MSAVVIEEAPDGLYRTRGADVELVFRISGEGTPVVLLHGTSANHAVWQPIADSLSECATVISLDQRGHGRSGKPPSGYDGKSFADDVVTVLDALELNRAVIAGHSLGARNAWLAASLYPDRVASVVAIDYVPFVEKGVLDDLQTRVADGDRVFTDVAEIERYLRKRYSKMPDDAILRRARWGYQTNEEGNWIPLAPPDALSQVVDGLRTPWDQEFKDVMAPLSCIRGATSAIVSDTAWERARAARPDARWLVADKADHYVPEECPAIVTDELSSILRKL